MRIVSDEDREGIQAGRIPRHVAVILDGNGRWALWRGQPRTNGHEAASDALMSMVEASIELGVEWLSVYAFSTENWDRPQDEVDFLMNFDEWLLKEKREELAERNVRIRFAGRNDRLPDKTIDAMAETVEMTADNDGTTLCICFNYGGRAELVDAVRQAVSEGVTAAEIDEALIGRYLYDPDMPDIDLLIRTSGEQRLSNFLLWQVAYAELVFIDTLLPDFRQGHFYSAVYEYQSRRRRLGGLASR